MEYSLYYELRTPKENDIKVHSISRIHYGRVEMAPILQTRFPNAFCQWKSVSFD